jgi:putative ABC transport system permease protein
VRLRHGHHSRELAITGIPADATLRRVLEPDGRVVPLPEEGVVVSRKLAEILDAAPGDVLEAELLEGGRGKRPMLLAGIVDDFVGLNGAMRKEPLHRWMREEPVATEVLMLVDRDRLDELYAALRRIPAVGGMALREGVLEQFQRQNTEILIVFTVILAIFASVIAVAVVYNNARVALSVRSRDLATLRVLGFTRREVSSILLLEQAAQVLLAIPPGLWLGRKLAELVSTMVDPELFRFPVIIFPRTYVFAVVIVLVSAIGSALLVRGRVDHLDLVAVLKARD